MLTSSLLINPATALMPTKGKTLTTAGTLMAATLRGATLSILMSGGITATTAVRCERKDRHLLRRQHHQPRRRRHYLCAMQISWTVLSQATMRAVRRKTSVESMRVTATSMLIAPAI